MQFSGSNSDGLDRIEKYPGCPLIKYSVYVSIQNFLASTNWNWKTLIFFGRRDQLPTYLIIIIIVQDEI